MSSSRKEDRTGDWFSPKEKKMAVPALLASRCSSTEYASRCCTVMVGGTLRCTHANAEAEAHKSKHREKERRGEERRRRKREKRKKKTKKKKKKK